MENEKPTIVTLERTSIVRSQTTPTFDDLTHDINSGEINELLVVAEGEEKTTWFVWALVLCSAISGLLFGYDTGVISGALVDIGNDLSHHALSNGKKELITSATTLGALIGGLAAGVMSDFVGRRPVLAMSDVVFIGGAITQAACKTVWSMERFRAVTVASETFFVYPAGSAPIGFSMIYMSWQTP